MGAPSRPPVLRPRPGGTEKSRLRPLDRPGGAGVEAGPKPLPGILWRIAHELARTGWNVRAAIHVARTSSVTGFRVGCQKFDLYKFGKCGITLA